MCPEQPVTYVSERSARCGITDPHWEDRLEMHTLSAETRRTTDYSDRMANCPEYKVTAMQVSPSDGPTEWQESYARHGEVSQRFLPVAAE